MNEFLNLLWLHCRIETSYGENIFVFIIISRKREELTRNYACNHRKCDLILMGHNKGNNGNRLRLHVFA